MVVVIINFNLISMIGYNNTFSFLNLRSSNPFFSILITTKVYCINYGPFEFSSFYMMILSELFPRSVFSVYIFSYMLNGIITILTNGSLSFIFYGFLFELIFTRSRYTSLEFLWDFHLLFSGFIYPLWLPEKSSESFYFHS